MESKQNNIALIDDIKKCIKEEISKKIEDFDIKNEKCENNLVATVFYNKNGWNFKDDNILSKRRILNKDTGIKIEDKTNDRIVIILESPHKEEYSKDIIAPAMGITGKKIKENLLDILNKTIDKPKEDTKEYDVILMNAIQYQTSLGIDTEYFRDRIWLTLWNKYEQRKEFIKNLKEYNADIIFNFCTNGSHKKDLIYILDKKKNNSDITFQYIDSLKLNIKKKKDNNLYIKDKIVCKAIKKGNTHMYLLKEFVQNAIEESELSKNNIKIFKGPHPSSWISKNKKSFIDEINKVK